MPFVAGQTAVIVPVPELDGLVGPWRAQYDPSTRQSVPAHVTIVVPFAPLSGLVIGDLADLIGATGELSVTFARFGTFPGGVLYLAPEPAEPFRALTRRLAARWPECPPYGGQWGDEPIPHLTLADATDDDTQHAIRAALAPSLPLTVTLRHAWLMSFDGERWRREAEFPLVTTPDGQQR